MRPSDLLGVVIRVCGLVAMVWALRQGWGAVHSIPSGVLKGEMSLGTAEYWLATVVAALGFGAVCFACADWLVGLSYRHSMPDSPPREVADTWPRDVFGLIVRTMGTAVFLYGCYYLLYGLADAVGLSKEESAGEMRSYLVFGIPAALFGLALVGGASLVVRFSFCLGDRRTTSSAAPSTERDNPAANPQGAATAGHPSGLDPSPTSPAAAPRGSS